MKITTDATDRINASLTVCYDEDCKDNFLSTARVIRNIAEMVLPYNSKPQKKRRSVNGIEKDINAIIEISPLALAEDISMLRQVVETAGDFRTEKVIFEKWKAIEKSFDAYLNIKTNSNDNKEIEKYAKRYASVLRNFAQYLVNIGTDLRTHMEKCNPQNKIDMEKMNELKGRIDKQDKRLDNTDKILKEHFPEDTDIGFDDEKRFEKAKRYRIRIYQLWDEYCGKFEGNQAEKCGRPSKEEFLKEYSGAEIKSDADGKPPLFLRDLIRNVKYLSKLFNARYVKRNRDKNRNRKVK